MVFYAAPSFFYHLNGRISYISIDFIRFEECDIIERMFQLKGILIVDDSLFVRRLLKDILMEANYTVFIEAKNGIEAIEKYKIFSPELVIMDIIMPELNGIDALKEIINIAPRCKGHYVYSFRRTEGDH